MQSIFLNAFDSTMWTAVGAVAQAGATILALITLLYSLSTFTSTLKNSRYGELDKMYHDLLALTMGKPYLRAGDVKQNNDQKADYDIYAFMVWNFLETIFDRCREEKPDLYDTWKPVLIHESNLHKEWFELNPDKFKNRFVNFIKTGCFDYEQLKNAV